MPEDRRPLTATLPIPEALSPEYLECHGVLPLVLEDGRLRLAAAVEPEQHVQDDMVRLYGVPVESTMDAMALGAQLDGDLVPIGNHEPIIKNDLSDPGRLHSERVDGGRAEHETLRR